MITPIWFAFAQTLRRQLGMNRNPNAEPAHEEPQSGISYSEHHDLLVKKALEMDEYGIHFGVYYSKKTRN